MQMFGEVSALATQQFIIVLHYLVLFGLVYLVESSFLLFLKKYFCIKAVSN